MESEYGSFQLLFTKDTIFNLIVMSFLEKNKGENRGYGTAGIGYIILPSNIGRKEYIERCYRNHQVDILPGRNYTKTHNVPITESALQMVTFPSSVDEVGSSVVWVREDFQNRPVVIGVLKNAGKASQLSSGQQQLIQEIGSQIAQVFLDASNGVIDISVFGTTERPAKVNIKAAGGSDDEINIEATGVVNSSARKHNTLATEEFNLTLNNGEKELIKIMGNEDKFQYSDQWGNIIITDKDKTEIKDGFGHTITFNKDEAHYTDQFNNEMIFNEDNTQILTSKFNVGQGNEHMVLGDTLKKLLEKLISAIKAIKVPTPNGISGNPINTAQFTAISDELNTILSQISNTD